MIDDLYTYARNPLKAQHRNIRINQGHTPGAIETLSVTPSDSPTVRPSGSSLQFKRKQHILHQISKTVVDTESCYHSLKISSKDLSNGAHHAELACAVKSVRSFKLVWVGSTFRLFDPSCTLATRRECPNFTIFERYVDTPTR